jgi:hypothetical protein
METDSSPKGIVWRGIGGLLANVGTTGTVLGLTWAQVGDVALKVGQGLVVLLSIVVGVYQWRKLRMEIKKLQK